MCILKTGNGNGKYQDAGAKEDVISYILNPAKTPLGYSGDYYIDATDVVGSMKAVSEYYGKLNGVQLRHFILSFTPQELSSLSAVNEIGKAVMLLFWSGISDDLRSAHG